LADVATYARKLGIDKIVLFPRDYPPEAQGRLINEADRLVGHMLLKSSQGMIIELAQ
jgi:hypothetical protein